MNHALVVVKVVYALKVSLLERREDGVNINWVGEHITRERALFSMSTTSGMVRCGLWFHPYPFIH